MPEKAVLGGGCFWCVEAVLKNMKGIVSIVPGYAGGQTQNPTYEQVCTGTTGHAEVVEVTFDPQIMSYSDLLRIFFTLHDPTTLNRQGNDIGTQYRSAIYYSGQEQKLTAQHVMQDIETQHVWPNPLVTELQQLQQFWPAEPKHHDYFNRNPNTGYCAAVVAPKVAKMRKLFSDRYTL
ncbi:peptide-methionine (S)-S-oxide reductase MsrA [Acetobacter orientalis]|uniref:Peptide methionine sulfoxide reductase MsrA n=1 Tax=Acetobacter orientalis TaxID=146474 RepID=A0A252A570_9PROT|nr:peptide-methionine (S)-S-oxide reductase MsrA [Acetobacter orientalis]OUI84553.1 methionine sulfoxide reductase A [Acetobacter orientalis]